MTQIAKCSPYQLLFREHDPFSEDTPTTQNNTCSPQENPSMN